LPLEPWRPAHRRSNRPLGAAPRSGARPELHRRAHRAARPRRDGGWRMNPVPPSSQSLPSPSDLCESPELAVLAVLQSTLRITGQVLDIHNPRAGTLEALTPDP